MRKFLRFIAVPGTAVVLVAGLTNGSALAGATGWSIQASPNPAGTTDAELLAVACPGASLCLSVGNYTSATTGLTLAERWNGTRWSLQTTPNPAGAKDSILSSLSCAGPRSCVAVGSWFTAKVVQKALVEAWNGTKWTIQAVPNPAGPGGGAGLDGVSCTAPDSCMAVGGLSRSGSAQEQPLAEHWNGTAWAIVPTPNPHAENGSFLAGVSCAAASACTAGGDFFYADINSSIFAQRWNGTAWATQKQPNPVGQSANIDSAVSCATVSACTTAGSWTNGGNVGVTLAEAWNGTTWAIQPTPNPAGSSGTQLAGVSCPRVTACTAVGTWSKNSTSLPTLTLAESWNGTRWSLQTTPNPAGGRISVLDGVACTTAGACVAVGHFWNGTSTQTLVERRTG